MDLGVYFMADFPKGLGTAVLEELGKVGQDVGKSVAETITGAPKQITQTKAAQPLSLDEMKSKEEEERKREIRRIRRRILAMQERARFRSKKQMEAVQNEQKEKRREEIPQLRREKLPPLPQVRRQQPETRPGYGG